MQCHGVVLIFGSTKMFFAPTFEIYFHQKAIWIAATDNGIHRIASDGYYGFRFVTPLLPQCVERFHRYRSNEKNVIARLLKFAGYIHNHKILPGNIFGLILKNKMAATCRFFMSADLSVS